MDEKAVIDLINQLVSADNQETVKSIHSSLLKTATNQGIKLQSIYPFYKKIADQKLTGFTIPAINLRALTFDFARTIFKIAKSKNATAFIIEIARSEQKYTNQSPAEFVSYILAAAIVENYSAPIFIQGDHYQIDISRFTSNQVEEVDSLKNLISDSVDAGFYNIDIDASTLVDYNHPTIDLQQQRNSQTTAELIKHIRSIQPQNLVINIGGEIGHIGGKNSTVEEADIFCNQLKSYLKTTNSISKLSIQTGTSHGGTIDSQGKIELMNVDLNLIKTIGQFIKDKYQLSGVVQHGASTLPDNLLPQFVTANTLEIHLSTRFQNIVFDTLPDDFRKKIYSYLFSNYVQEWDSSWTEAQFIYRVRKKTLGHYKKELFELTADQKQPILVEFGKTIEIIFDKLNISTTGEMIKSIY